MADLVNPRRRRVYTQEQKLRQQLRSRAEHQAKTELAGNHRDEYTKLYQARCRALFEQAGLPWGGDDE